MADLILKVTPEEVRQKAREIMNQKNLMSGLMDQMGNEVNRLADYWQSTSGEDYRTKYQHVTRNINNSLEDLLQKVNNLNDAAQRYDEVENSQVQRTNSLSTNNIF
ncbi:MAG: WXG100 family type VII secretion target [Provencibacterium sp.]|jgi:WXG100 family type VII secretion target|nr:WXG100 family type VII secretion target [Provencibacterium sp.]